MSLLVDCCFLLFYFFPKIVFRIGALTKIIQNTKNRLGSELNLQLFFLNRNQLVGVKAKLTFLDDWSSLCTGTRATPLHLSLRSSSSICHWVFQGYPISSRQKSIPGPWDRPSINSGGRNMGQPPELKPPPSSPALCTTQSKWTHYFSSNFIQPTAETSIQCFNPQGCSDGSIPAMIHSNAPSHSRKSLQADRCRCECVHVHGYKCGVDARV